MEGWVANGNITPSRGCIIDTTATGTRKVIQDATGGGRIVGISQKGTRYAGGTPADDGFAAIAGEDVRLHTWEDAYPVCGVELGGTVAVGDMLKTDSSGRGVTTTTTSDIVFAMAMQAGVSGDVIDVRLVAPHPYG